jgi:D-psicose/D-tagatose/L-ribulose 3-epimerase
MDIGYTGPLVIESFSPDFKEFSRNVAIWRKLANSGDEIAIEWLKNLRNIEKYNPVMPVTTGGGQNAT